MTNQDAYLESLKTELKEWNLAIENMKKKIEAVSSEER